MSELDDRLAGLARAIEGRGAAGLSDVVARRRRRRNRARAAASALVAAMVISVAAVMSSSHPRRRLTTVDQPTTTLAPVGVAPSSTTTTSLVSHPPVELVDLTWISETRGWALGASATCKGESCAAVFSTSDGGQTWAFAGSARACVATEVAPCPDAAARVSNIRFANASVGYLFGSHLFMTNDGGHTWVAQGGRPVEALEIAGSSVVRLSYSATGCPGPCDTSADVATVGSTTWRQSKATNAPFGSVLARGDSGDVYVAAVGHRSGGAGSALATWYVSHDNGTTWTARQDPCGAATGPDEIDTSSLAAAPGHVVAALCEHRVAGGAGLVALSTDGGRTFGAPRALPGTEGPVAITVTTAHDVAVATRSESNSQVLVSHDGGQNWTTAASTEAAPSLRLATPYLGFQSRSVGRWMDDRRAVWTTTDGGDHWTRRPVA